MVKKAGILLLLLVLLGYTKISFAQAGGLDSSFGVNGKVVSLAVESYGQPKGMAILADGKIVIAGAADNKFSVFRFKTNGQIDSSFGNNGGKIFTFAISGLPFPPYFGADSSGGAEAVVIQPDGKILVAGTWHKFDNSAIVMARLKLNGDFDSSFGINGKVVTESYSINFKGYFTANALALQPNGKIITGGSLNVITEMGYVHSNFALVRYKTNGTIDSSFGINGIVNTEFGGAHHTVYSLLIQPDDKIVAAGTAYAVNGVIQDIYAVARYNANGELDTPFGNNGKIVTDFGGAYEVYDHVSVALQNGGEIVIAGSDNNADFALARYKTNGEPDASFGNNGKLLTDFAGSNDVAYSVVIQQDNKIIAAGDINEDNKSYFGLIRYNPDGKPDTTFGNNGKVATDLNGTNSFARVAAIQPGGKIVVAGYTYISMNDFTNLFAAARYKGFERLALKNIKVGNWSDPAVWNIQRVPVATDDVEIDFDIVVDVNSNCNSITVMPKKSVLISNGVLLKVKKN